MKTTMNKSFAINNDDTSLSHALNHLIEHAIDKKASDIHLEPHETFCRIRLRQDGILYETDTLSEDIAKRLIIKIKIMAKLDITEQRLPQDGRFNFQLYTSYNVDVRVSTCPTLYGEKIVLRLLDHHDTFRNINQLGLNATQQRMFVNTIHKPQGLILATGPTGSGKTSTLYAALAHLNSTEKNISTVEDPIEINLSGINQVNINLKSGLTFSRILRAFLRQDSDIILVGEIRDPETAEIAIKAAQTGHLVFSTLHTNHSYEALIRLQHMGIAPYHIASSITLVTAQRLVRKLCPHCKTEDHLPIHLQKQLNLNTPIFKAFGCKHCINGYTGRIAIHEILPINEDTSNRMLQKNDLQELFKIKNKPEFIDLRKSALEKVAEGETSLEEVNRVI